MLKLEFKTEKGYTTRELQESDLINAINQFLKFRTAQKINTSVKVLYNDIQVLFMLEKTKRYNKRGKYFIDEYAIKKVLNENNVEWSFGCIKVY